MLWLPTAAAEPRHVISLCYIRLVWMNNEECLSLQNIPASLPRVLLPAQTGSCWASGTGAVGREGGGLRKHRGGLRRNWSFSQLCMLLFVLEKEISLQEKLSYRARKVPRSENKCYRRISWKMSAVWVEVKRLIKARHLHWQPSNWFSSVLVWRAELSTCWVSGIFLSRNTVNYLLLAYIVHKNKPHKWTQLHAYFVSYMHSHSSGFHS